jgi:hypothetical protein
MGREAVNITRLKRQNDMYAAADHHAHELQVAKSRASWFSRDMERPAQSGLTAETKEFVAEPSSIIERFKVTRKDKIAQELDMANRMLAVQRKEQLRGKLQAEREQFERELNAMGLAFDKHRD